MRNIVIFGGSSHPDLTSELCLNLGVAPGLAELKHFTNGCMEVQLQDNCNERDVFIVQPLVAPVHDNLFELLLMIDAARNASAGRTIAVIPYYSYARSDKKDSFQISIAGRLVADLLVAAGVDRILTIALHSPQVQGFFSVPVDHLSAMSEFVMHLRGYDLTNSVIVSPDLGGAKPAANLAKLLDAGFAACMKERYNDGRVRIGAILGDVVDRDVIVFDDEIIGGVTIFELLERLHDHGTRSVRIVCTHGLFVGDTLQQLENEPDVTEIICTNTVPIPLDKHVSKLTVLSVIPTLVSAVHRIHHGEPVNEQSP